MSKYGGTAGGTSWTGPYIPATVALIPGDLPQTLWNAEARVAGDFSPAVCLSKKDESHPGTVSIEGFFSGAPGAFEIDLQTSDTDADGMYQQEGLGITVANSQNAFRGEFMSVSANFARVNLKSLGNAVNITLRINYR
jgi:hypothetical protein